VSSRFEDHSEICESQLRTVAQIPASLAIAIFFIFSFPPKLSCGCYLPLAGESAEKALMRLEMTNELKLQNCTDFNTPTSRILNLVNKIEELVDAGEQKADDLDSAIQSLETIISDLEDVESEDAELYGIL
jgi:hypothetical protein